MHVIVQLDTGAPHVQMFVQVVLIIHVMGMVFVIKQVESAYVIGTGMVQPAQHVPQAGLVVIALSMFRHRQ